MNWTLLRRSRNSTVVLTADGEVHAHEDAQVFVHDLNLFVTVQLLEETTHGYSYEWVSGQKTTVDPKWELYCLQNRPLRTSCRTQGYPPIPGSVSSSTLPPQDSSSSSSSPVLERSDEMAPRKWCRSTQKTRNKNQNRDDSRDSDDRLRDLPEWLEEFSDNLEDTEVPAPAHISQDSDSERLTKVVSTSRKHNIYTPFPKDRNCEVCLQTKITRTPCRRQTGEPVCRAEKTACSTEGGRRCSARGQGRDVTRSCLDQTFLVNPAVLSRCRVLCLKMLEFVAVCNLNANSRCENALQPPVRRIRQRRMERWDGPSWRSTETLPLPQLREGGGKTPSQRRRDRSRGPGREWTTSGESLAGSTRRKSDEKIRNFRKSGLRGGCRYRAHGLRRSGSWYGEGPEGVHGALLLTSETWKVRRERSFPLHIGNWTVVFEEADRGVEQKELTETGQGPEIPEAGPALFGSIVGEGLGAQSCDFGRRTGFRPALETDGRNEFDRSKECSIGEAKTEVAALAEEMPNQVEERWES